MPGEELMNTELSTQIIDSGNVAVNEGLRKEEIGFNVNKDLFTEKSWDSIKTNAFMGRLEDEKVKNMFTTYEGVKTTEEGREAMSQTIQRRDANFVINAMGGILSGEIARVEINPEKNEALMGECVKNLLDIQREYKERLQELSKTNLTGKLRDIYQRKHKSEATDSQLADRMEKIISKTVEFSKDLYINLALIATAEDYGLKSEYVDKICQLEPSEANKIGGRELKECFKVNEADKAVLYQTCDGKTEIKMDNPDVYPAIMKREITAYFKNIAVKLI